MSLDNARPRMTLALDHLPQPPSLLSRLDPRGKLAALLVAVVAVAVLQTLRASLLALVGALLLVILGRLPLRWYLARLTTLAAFLLLFVLLVPFLVHDNGPAWVWGPLRLSGYGLRVALLVCVKALTIVSLGLTILTTAPLSVTLKAAHALHLPGLFVQLVMLSYRYIFVLGTEFSRLRTALRVRGYRNRFSQHSYRTIGHVAGTLLVRGYERAERVSQAMRCRGFDGRLRCLAEFRCTPADVLFVGLIVGGALLLLILDWRHG